MRRCDSRGCGKIALWRLAAIAALWLLVPYNLFAQYSVGVETNLSLSTGIVARYEESRFRGELACHFFPWEYIREAISASPYAYKPPIVGEALAAWRFASWKHHALYAGAGMSIYLDGNASSWEIGAGPLLQYAWKIPSRSIELSLDFFLPLLFIDNYVDDAVDDFPSTESLVAMMLIVMGPSIGISWMF